MTQNTPKSDERRAGSAMEVNMDKIRIVDHKAEEEDVHINDTIHPDKRAFPNQVLPNLHRKTYFKAA